MSKAGRQWTTVLVCKECGQEIPIDIEPTTADVYNDWPEPETIQKSLKRIGMWHKKGEKNGENS